MSAETRREKSSEVDALIRCHGWTFADACQLVVILPIQYLPGSAKIEWIPTPDDIERMKPSRHPEREIGWGDRQRGVMLGEVTTAELLAGCG